MEVLAVDAVGSKALGTDVGDEASADPVPAWLFAFPLERAAGPGKLLPVKESANEANYVVGEAAAW